MTPLPHSQREGLLAFLNYGVLGPIRAGMSLPEVQHLVGCTEHIHIAQGIDLPLETHLYYPWLELTFNAGVLDYLSLRYKWQQGPQRLERLRLPGRFAAPWAKSIAYWNYLRFRSFVYSTGHGYWLKAWEDGSLTLQLPSGGGVIFNDPKSVGLHSVNFVTGPPGSQLSGVVFVPPITPFQRIFRK